MPYKAYIKTISTDNRTELICHERRSKALDTNIYILPIRIPRTERSHRKREETDTAKHTKVQFVRRVLYQKKPNLYTRLSSDQEKN